MPEVSVIIPVYNIEKFVEKCIRSVMGQTFRDLEILAVNDGSTDRSGEILERLAAEDSRIVYISQENRGVAAARNRAVDMARGKYLTFVDGDDYIGRDYISRLYAAAEKKNAEMLICGVTCVDAEGKVLSRIVPGEYRRFEKEEWTFRISAVWAHFYRRSLWEKYDIRFRSGERGEDMPVSLFFSAVCDKIATISEAGYYYVQHPSSAVHNFRGLKKYRLPYVALEDAIRKIRETGISNSPEFCELFVLRILSTCFFQLAPGASKDKMKELCDYIIRILDTYFPQYCKNRKARLTAPLDIPLVQKAAVKILILLVRTRAIYPVGRLMSRKQRRRG